MSRVCDICEKRYLKSNLVPRGVGRRVTRRTITKQKPNIRRKKMVIDGTPQTINICSSCLKRIKFNKKQEQAKQEAAKNKA